MLVVVLVSCAVYLVNTNASPLGDTAAAIPIATSIVRDGDLLLDEYREASGFVDGGWVSENEDGELVGYFPWAVAVSAIPFVVLVDGAEAVGIGSGSYAVALTMDGGHARLQNLVAAWWTAVSVGGVFVLARRRLRGDGLRALAVASVYAFGTSAWSTAAFQLWQHGPSLACISWSLVLVDRWLRCVEASDRRRIVEAAALGGLAAAGYAIRPTNALLVAALTIWVLTRFVGGEKRAPIAAIGGAAAVGVLWLLATRATYGTWLQPYNQAGRIGWHASFAEALAADLVSPGRGLLVFSPVAAIAVVGAVWVVARRAEADAVMWISMGVLVSHWVIIAALGHWTGGHSFGPRLFTDGLPYLVVLALPVVDRLKLHTDAGRIAPATLGVALLVLASVAIHAQSTLIISTRCWNALPVDVDDDPSRVWDWGDPMVTTGFRDLVRAPASSLRGRCTRS